MELCTKTFPSLSGLITLSTLSVFICIGTANAQLAGRTQWGLLPIEKTALSEPISTIPNADRGAVKTILIQARLKLKNDLSRLSKMAGPVQDQLGTGDFETNLPPLTYAGTLLTESVASTFAQYVKTARSIIHQAKKSNDYGLLNQYQEAIFWEIYWENCTFGGSTADGDKAIAILNCPADRNVSHRSFDSWLDRETLLNNQIDQINWPATQYQQEQAQLKEANQKISDLSN